MICECDQRRALQDCTDTQTQLSIVKPVLRSQLKIDKTKILMENGSLMKVKSIAMILFEHSAILFTCIKLYSVLRTNFDRFFCICCLQMRLVPTSQVLAQNFVLAQIRLSQTNRAFGCYFSKTRLYNGYRFGGLI